MNYQEHVAISKAILKLTEQEGHCVTVYYPNPDFDGPAYMIEHSVDYGANFQKFCGESLIESLNAAIDI